MHIFCLPMHLYHHMYKRFWISRHRFYNEKVTYTAFTTILWVVHVQVFKTLEWKKLLEIKIMFWALMKKKLACPPKPVSSTYIYIYIYNIYIYIYISYLYLYLNMYKHIHIYKSSTNQNLKSPSIRVLFLILNYIQKRSCSSKKLL